MSEEIKPFGKAKHGKTFLERTQQKGKVKRDESEAEFNERLNRLIQTEDGRYVMQRLVNICGFTQSSILTGEDGKVDVNAVQYNEGRRSVYLDVRKRLTVKSKHVIET